jgi:hypothetical protein
VAKGSDAFLTAEPFQQDADPVVNGMMLARRATDMAHQLFDWQTGRRGGGFLAHLHFSWGYDESDESFAAQIANLVS